MSETWKLKRTKQCQTCPWRMDSTTADIPNYEENLHIGLDPTISNGSLNLGSIKAMACHYFKDGQEDYCIGWLWNQIGIGNNIGLRMKMRFCENFKEVEVIGEQVETFAETFK
jgi:hypothetical protein